MEVRKEKSAEVPKAYARSCGKLSAKYKLDFEFCLTLSTDEQMYKRFIGTVERSSGRHYGGLDKAHMALLSQDRSKQRASVKFLLDRALYDALNLDNDTNLERVKRYLNWNVAWDTANQWTAPKWTWL